MRHGHHACKSVDMVVVDDLARVHSDEFDLGWVLHLLYVVARGLPLTTFSCAYALKGEMKRILSPWVREHVPLLHTPFYFILPKSLHAEYPALATAIKAVKLLEESRWDYQLVESMPSTTTRQPAAPKAKAKGAPKKVGRPKAQQKRVTVLIPDLLSMWKWLKANRCTRNGGEARMCWRRGLPLPL